VPDPVWIVSLVLLWAVVGLLCLVVLSLLRQVGALRLRLESEAGRPVGLALGEMVEAARQGGWSAGGVRERDWGESVPSW
jgi:hypothetical protein